jgi:hypothetical protein
MKPDLLACRRTGPILEFRVLSFDWGLWLRNHCNLGKWLLLVFLANNSLDQFLLVAATPWNTMAPEFVMLNNFSACGLGNSSPLLLIGRAS